MLKRLLSAILTAAMILSFIPTAFASGETAATEVENVKIVYAAGSSLTSTTAEYYTKVITPMNGSANKPFSEVTDYSMYNGFWMYGGYKSFDGTAWDTGYKRASKYGYLEFDKMKLGYWHGLKFHVPVSGTYDMTLYAYSTSGGGHCRFAWTVVPASTAKADIDELMKTVSWNATSTDGKEGTLSASAGIYAFNAVYEYGSGANPSQKQSVTFDKAGDYILVLQNVQYNPSKTTTDATTGETIVDEWSASKILLKGFSLSKGENPTSVPMGITSLTDSEITVGETTTASFGTLYGSGDWATYDTTDSTITYVSSNEKVATVDATGNVTGKGAGTVEIAAVIDGATLVSAPITVGAPSVKIVYDVANTWGKTAGIATADTAYYDEVSKAFEYNNSSAFLLEGNFDDYSPANGLWRYVTHKADVSPTINRGMWRFPDHTVGGWFAIGFNVPVAGNYDIAIQGHDNGSSNNGCHVAYKIFPAGTSSETIEATMSGINWYDDGTNYGAVSGAPLCWQRGNIGGAMTNRPSVTAEYDFTTAGEYILVAKSLKAGTHTQMFVDHFILTQSDNTGILPIGYTKLSANEIAIGATAQAAISDKLYNANDWGSYDATGATVTYKSSAPSVAAVDETTGVVTAKATGTAEITAIVDGAQLAPTTITVTKYESAPKSLSLWVESDADDAVSVTVDGNPVSVGNVAAATQGATVKVTAEDTETYRFSHWLGTAGVASFDKEYTFNIYTNTALKAVYETKPTDVQAIVSFYKPNRELFATKVVNKNTLFSAAKPETNDISLVGYNTFLGWALGEDENEQPIMVEDGYEITGDLGVVAVFDGKKTVKNFKVGSNEADDVSYGEEFNEHSTGGDNFSYWKRNDHIVSYNKTYTFYAWQDNAEIKSVVSGYEEAKPVAILENYDADIWMFEYEIPANCTRLEAGIIFGNSSDITIDSCYARAVSRRGAEDKHGQFTASSDYSFAKGYIIFKDSSNKICVVYSK